MVWDPSYGGKIPLQLHNPEQWAQDPRTPVPPPSTTPYLAATGPFKKGACVGEAAGYHVCLVDGAMDAPPATATSNDHWHWSVGPSPAGA